MAVHDKKQVRRFAQDDMIAAIEQCISVGRSTEWGAKLRNEAKKLLRLSNL